MNKRLLRQNHFLAKKKKKKKLYWVAFKSDASTAVLKDEGVI